MWKWVTQSCPTLCNSMDYTVHGILQARKLKWVAIPFSKGSSQPREGTQVSRIAGDSLPVEPQALVMKEKNLQWRDYSTQRDLIQLQHQSFQWIFKTDLPHAPYNLFFDLLIKDSSDLQNSYMFIDLYLTGFLFEYSLKQASLMVQLVKNLQCRRPGFNPWVGKIPWRREWLPTPVLWPGEFHRLYSPWGHKESDTTEWLSLTLFTVKSKAIIKSTMFGVLKYLFIYLTVWGLSCSPWA